MTSMKQSVIVCTSRTRPAPPTEGMVIYEADTDKILIYTTDSHNDVDAAVEPAVGVSRALP